MLSAHPDYRLMRAIVSRRVPRHLREDAMQHAVLAAAEAERTGAPKALVIHRRVIDYIRRELGTRRRQVQPECKPIKRPSRPERSFRLTPRRLSVLHGIVLGRTDKEIAAGLGVSDRTVEYHVRRLFLAFGVGRRMELAEAARRHGVVADPSPEQELARAVHDLQQRVAMLERKTVSHLRNYHWKG